mmetsp:Transcript_16505/g.30886  ORF Transcript_16505/g.30886 Transcript_16505/m.30886 type:complete len:96 (+) Transcript_16505:768-1055(+)
MSIETTQQIAFHPHNDSIMRNIANSLTTRYNHDYDYITIRINKLNTSSKLNNVYEEYMAAPCCEEDSLPPCDSLCDLPLRLPPIPSPCMDGCRCS